MNLSFATVHANVTLIKEHGSRAQFPILNSPRPIWPSVYQTLPWSQRLSFYWQILRRESLLKLFFYWHEALRAEKRKPLVATVGNLTFMPSGFDRRFWLEDIFNCPMSHMIGWIKSWSLGWEWSVYVHIYGYGWRTFALSTDSLVELAYTRRSW